jgi:inositol 1,4,5-triphosphate receptor type 1
LAEQLRPTQADVHGDLQTDPALLYYFKHTGQIEIVRQERVMEQIIFPIPEICEYLTEETKQRVFLTTERDDQNSKVTDFFERHEGLFNEMNWQKKLRCECAVVFATINKYFMANEVVH